MKYYNKNYAPCPKCKKIFNTRYGYRKYCSRECERLDRKGKGGGYREGSGRSKSGYYKGIYCGSTYELVYVIYRLDHNLCVKRFDGYIKNDKICYYPDFIEGNLITEIKGYYTQLVDEKSKLAKENGYDIQVLYKKDLIYAFNWAKENYQYKVLTDLYDNYKPRYKYICDYCKKEFYSEKKKKTEHVFCSRTCCGKYNCSNKEIKKKQYLSLMKTLSLKPHKNIKLYKQRENGKLIREKRIFRINLVLNNTEKIDFNHRGWSERLKQILMMSRRDRAVRWLKTNIPDLYMKIKTDSSN